MLKKLLTRPVNTLVCCLYPDLIAKLKVYRTTVFANVTLFLCERDMTVRLRSSYYAYAWRTAQLVFG